MTHFKVLILPARDSKFCALVGHVKYYPWDNKVLYSQVSMVTALNLGKVACNYCSGSV